MGENEAAESRPAEFVVGNVDDDELEEPEELRKVTVGRTPTETQRGEREGENQSVSARGTGAQHQHRRRKRPVDQEQRGPEFSRTKSEVQSPCLHSISRDLEGLQRQHFRAERVTEFGVTFFARFIEKTGMKRFINFRDSEPSILAPKDAAARSLPLVESILESCPVGDHRSNGSIEASVRELKGQTRAVRMRLEKKDLTRRWRTMTHSCEDSNILRVCGLTISTRCGRLHPFRIYWDRGGCQRSATAGPAERWVQHKGQEWIKFNCDTGDRYDSPTCGTS